MRCDLWYYIAQAVKKSACRQQGIVTIPPYLNSIASTNLTILTALVIVSSISKLQLYLIVECAHKLRYDLVLTFAEHISTTINFTTLRYETKFLRSLTLYLTHYNIM